MSEPTPSPNLSPRSEQLGRAERNIDAHARLGREIVDRNKSVIERIKIATLPNDIQTDDFYRNVFRFHARHQILDERLNPQLTDGRDARAAVHALVSAVPYTMSERVRIDAQDYDQKFEIRNGENIRMSVLNDPAFRREAGIYAEQISEDPAHYSGAIIMLDVNDFKLYNNTHTETVGDDALRNVGQGMKDALRTDARVQEKSNGSRQTGQDLVGRTSGDEWNALLRDFHVLSTDDPSMKLSAPTDFLGHPAERIRLQVSNSNKFPAPEAKVTVGYSAILPGETAQQAMDRASDAKKIGNLQKGKNRTVIARPDLGVDIFIDITNGEETKFQVFRHTAKKKGGKGKFATLVNSTQNYRYPVLQLGEDKMKLGEPSPIQPT